MPKTKHEPQPTITVRVPPKVRKTLEAAARRKGVGLSEYLRWLLIERAERERKRK